MLSMRSEAVKSPVTVLDLPYLTSEEQRELKFQLIPQSEQYVFQPIFCPLRGPSPLSSASTTPTRTGSRGPSATPEAEPTKDKEVEVVLQSPSPTDEILLERPVAREIGGLEVNFLWDARKRLSSAESLDVLVAERRRRATLSCADGSPSNKGSTDGDGASSSSNNSNNSSSYVRSATPTMLVLQPLGEKNKTWPSLPAVSTASEPLKESTGLALVDLEHTTGMKKPVGKKRLQTILGGSSPINSIRSPPREIVETLENLRLQAENNEEDELLLLNDQANLSPEESPDRSAAFLEPRCPAPSPMTMLKGDIEKYNKVIGTSSLSSSSTSSSSRIATIRRQGEEYPHPRPEEVATNINANNGEGAALLNSSHMPQTYADSTSFPTEGFCSSSTTVSDTDDDTDTDTNTTNSANTTPTLDSTHSSPTATTNRSAAASRPTSTTGISFAPRTARGGKSSRPEGVPRLSLEKLARASSYNNLNSLKETPSRLAISPRAIKDKRSSWLINSGPTQCSPDRNKGVISISPRSAFSRSGKATIHSSLINFKRPS
ncbi:hypothetical protein QOT17_001675 [Balamuthia mandrillaris]